MELLFENRTNLGGFNGHLNFIQHPAEIHPEPVVRPDTFADRKGVSIYGTVLRDGGRLRMWYLTIPESWHYECDMNSYGYAESDDGISWTKPKVGLVECGPEPNNLINLGLHSATVFVDPDGPPSHRYRATGAAYPGQFLINPEIDAAGYFTAHSADGLDWELDSTSPRWRSTDVITSIYHPAQRRGITALKFTPRWMRMGRRSIHTAEFRDGEFSDAVSALYPDEFDDMCAATRGYHTCDYYGTGMLPAGSGTVGFLWKYWHELPYTGPSHHALYGTSDVALTYQPERGGRWFHVPGRPIFIDHTALPWTRGWINTASNVVEVGDEQRLYFSGQPYSHGFGFDVNWRVAPKWADYMAAHPRAGITFARWPKWRLFGFQSDPEGSFHIGLGRIEKPSEVVLNYEITKPEGSIRVELGGEGIEGRTLEESVPLTGDSLGETVAWKSGSVIAPCASATLVLHLECARVYAYEVRPVE